MKLPLALLLLAPLPALAQARHEPGMPPATCRVLAEAGAPMPVQGHVGEGEDLVLPVIVRCEKLDGSDASVELERVEVSYSFPERRGMSAARKLKQDLDASCGDGEMTVQVKVLSSEMLDRPPFRDMTSPMRAVAHLSFRARQSSGKKKLCFGSMEWELDLLPGKRTD